MAPSKNIQLTARETEMLVAVVSVMGDVPAVDFQRVAPMVGQKYARNARASCKKLFDKLKSSTGNGASASGTDAADEDEGDDEDEEVEKAPVKSVGKSKAAAKTEPKKTVGRRAAPKKAAAGGLKAKGKGAKAKKEAVKDESEEEANDDVEMKDEAGEEAANEDGKSPNSVNMSQASAAQGNEVSAAGNPANDYTEDEIYEANYRDITVEEWRVWAAENNWDPNYAPTPKAYVSDEEV